MVVDATKGVNYLVEIKDSVAAGFHWTCKQSVLRGDEPMRGIRYNPMDVTRHAVGTRCRGAGPQRESGWIGPHLSASLPESFYVSAPDM